MARVDSPLKGFIGLWPMTVNSAFRELSIKASHSPLVNEREHATTREKAPQRLYVKVLLKITV